MPLKKVSVFGIIMLFVGTSLIPSINGDSITIKNIATKWFTGFPGYTKVIMEKNHTLLVNISPATSYAGEATMYDINVDLLGGGHPAANGLTIALYNSTGALVTGEDAWSKTGSYSIIDEEIILSGGTFYLYAYNDTHDSQGHNATILVTKFTVASSPSVLAWKIDTDTNMTFQLTPAGNGTLTLFNMSSVPEAAEVGQSTQITMEDGVGTLNGVNATTIGNVTFGYTPDGGAERSADGLLRVTTATATPIPATIYIGEATLVTITITHPATGIPLADIEVGLDLDKNISTTILSELPENQFTDGQGKVTFTLIAIATGIITIFIENETDPDNEFVIVAVANQPPNPPTITGPHYGKTNTTYTFSIGAITDPDGDQLYCLWDWGDGNTSGWLGPINSGQTVSALHAWSEPGTYPIKVKLKDSYGAESDWSEPFTITIVQLQPAIFLGLFNNVTQTEDLIIFEARLFLVFPSEKIIYTGGMIVISKDYLGSLGTTFTLGVGGVAIP